MRRDGSLNGAASPPSPNVVGDGLERRRLSEVQRSRLLTGMVDEVLERGVANVAVAHVVGRAGVSRRTFYELFEDREACFLAALDDAIARASRCVLSAYDPQARWVERVRTALTALLRFLDAERGVAQLLLVASLSGGQKASERRERGIAQIITVVDEGRKESRRGSEIQPITAEGIVGGVLSIIHARVLAPTGSNAIRGSTGADSKRESLLGLAGPLMSMIVLPYLGSAAARREFERPSPELRMANQLGGGDPLRDIDMRLTYRTIRVLLSVATKPESSNRNIGLAAGIADQGQISKLLSRLERLGLVHNKGFAPGRGTPNAWTLTAKGREVEQTMGGHDGN